jgi:hypothetical protein
MKFRLLRTPIVFVLLLTIWGCVSDPVAVNLPANHPADPGARVAAYKAVQD